MAYGLQVLGDQREDMYKDQCENQGDFINETDGNHCQESATNATNKAVSSDAISGVNDTIEGVAKLPEKLPTIVTIIVAAVIIGILVRYLVVR